MDPQVTSAILQMLRDARALAYRDAESFDAAATVLEHIGQLLSGEVRIGLGAYEGEILGLAGQVPRVNARELRELFRTVREARNECVHSGDYIRHHVLRLVELFLLLEEAISMNGRVACDLMVRHPLVAEQWHNVATVRRNMLTNSFSYLPVLDPDGVWRLLADWTVVAYLRGCNGQERNRRLGTTVGTLLTENRLETLACPIIPPDTPLDRIRDTCKHLPQLVVDEQNHLLGIATAFDLL